MVVQGQAKACPCSFTVILYFGVPIKEQGVNLRRFGIIGT